MAELKKGEWVYNPHTYCLVYYEKHGPYPYHETYYVDLERMKNSSEMLDFIMQVFRKKWVTPEVMNGFLNGLHYLFDVQTDFCPCGRDKFKNALQKIREVGWRIFPRPPAEYEPRERGKPPFGHSLQEIEEAEEKCEEKWKADSYARLKELGIIKEEDQV
jgi:hypothetical protein